jgi:arsenate reductase
MNTLFPPLQKTIASLNTVDISASRKDILQVLIDFIQDKVDRKEAILLNFICTHNSRRSHLSQIWAQTMGAYFKVNNLFCYSAGTEATAVYPVILATLKTSGFEMESLSQGVNPIYALKYGPNGTPIIAFSKTLDHSFNPTEGFAAIMTCSQADNNCPFIVGADKRIPLTYEDPKLFDDTPEQAQKYAERSHQIAVEMKYVFAQIKHSNE